MSGLDEIYEDSTGEPRAVIRISRTTNGTRTYTVGASVALDDVTDEVIRAVVDVERRLAAELDSLLAGATVTDVSGQGEIIPIARVRHGANSTENRALAELAVADGEGWYTTDELVQRLGISRQAVVARLSKMHRAGQVEYVRGGGKGKASMYRLAVGEGVNE